MMAAAPLERWLVLSPAFAAWFNALSYAAVLRSYWAAGTNYTTYIIQRFLIAKKVPERFHKIKKNLSLGISGRYIGQPPKPYAELFIGYCETRQSVSWQTMSYASKIRADCINAVHHLLALPSGGIAVGTRDGKVRLFNRTAVAGGVTGSGGGQQRQAYAMLSGSGCPFMNALLALPGGGIAVGNEGRGLSLFNATAVMGGAAGGGILQQPQPYATLFKGTNVLVFLVLPGGGVAVDTNVYLPGQDAERCPAHQMSVAGEPECRDCPDEWGSVPGSGACTLPTALWFPGGVLPALAIAACCLAAANAAASALTPAPWRVHGRTAALAERPAASGIVREKKEGRRVRTCGGCWRLATVLAASVPHVPHMPIDAVMPRGATAAAATLAALPPLAIAVVAIRRRRCAAAAAAALLAASTAAAGTAASLTIPSLPEESGFITPAVAVAAPLAAAVASCNLFLSAEIHIAAQLRGSSHGVHALAVLATACHVAVAAIAYALRRTYAVSVLVGASSATWLGTAAAAALLLGSTLGVAGATVARYVNAQLPSSSNDEERLARISVKDALSALVNSTVRVAFKGAVDGVSPECVVSFPGKYAELWDTLVGGCDAAVRKTFSVACVFLTDVESGLGAHSPDTGDLGEDEECFCRMLYGEVPEETYIRIFKGSEAEDDEEYARKIAFAKIDADAMGQIFFEENAFSKNKRDKALAKANKHARKKWKANNGRAPLGCMWFKAWAENVDKAVALKKEFIVYYFDGEKGMGKVAWEDLTDDKKRQPGVGLGGSQKAEVAYLDTKVAAGKLGYDYTERDISEFESSVNSTKPGWQWRILRTWTGTHLIAVIIWILSLVLFSCEYKTLGKTAPRSARRLFCLVILSINSIGVLLSLMSVLFDHLPNVPTLWTLKDRHFRCLVLLKMIAITLKLCTLNLGGTENLHAVTKFADPGSDWRLIRSVATCAEAKVRLMGEFHAIQHCADVVRNDGGTDRGDYFMRNSTHCWRVKFSTGPSKHNTAQYNTAQHNTTQRNATQRNTAQPAQHNLMTSALQVGNMA